MTSATVARAARPGDLITVHAAGQGRPARKGEILEVLGRPGHERYRVRWDEEHESIFYPADGVTVELGHVHAGGVAAARGLAPMSSWAPIRGPSSRRLRAPGRRMVRR